MQHRYGNIPLIFDNGAPRLSQTKYSRDYFSWVSLTNFQIFSLVSLTIFWSTNFFFSESRVTRLHVWQFARTGCSYPHHHPTTATVKFIFVNLNCGQWKANQNVEQRRWALSGQNFSLILSCKIFCSVRSFWLFWTENSFRSTWVSYDESMPYMILLLSYLSTNLIISLTRKPKHQ